MKLSAEEISKLVDGTVYGDKAVTVDKIAPIETADGASLTFLSHPKYFTYLNQTIAPVVLVNSDFNPDSTNAKTFIAVDEVYTALSVLLEKFHPDPNTFEKSGVSDKAYIESSAKIEEGAYVGPFAFIGKNSHIGENAKIFPHAYIGEDVEIGKNTIVFSGAKLYAKTKVGDKCVLHSGCIIGSDGFGFVADKSGNYKKIPQAGNVIIKNHVEVGANTTIDRATLTSTVIHNGVKLDNLIQIAHNVTIGDNTVIAAQAGVSGSTHIGKQNQIGGQVGIVGHIKTADGTLIGAKSGVGRDLNEPGKKWTGIPVEPYLLTLRSQAVIKNLPDMQKRIRELEIEIANLKKNI